jgi:hypothetical protein
MAGGPAPTITTHGKPGRSNSWGKLYLRGAPRKDRAGLAKLNRPQAKANRQFDWI